MYEKMLEVIKWWASHLLFTMIVGLSGLGAYQVDEWYKSIQPTQFDASQYDDESLSRITKSVFEEQQIRRKENR